MKVGMINLVRNSLQCIKITKSSYKNIK